MYHYRIEEVAGTEEGFGMFRYTVTQSIETHLHDFIELVYIQNGMGVHTVGGMEYPVRRGDLLLIKYGQTHAFHTASSMDIVNLMLKPEFIGAELIRSDNTFELLALTAFEEFQTSVSANPLVHLSPDVRVDAEFLLDKLYSEYQNRTAGYKTLLRAYLTALLTLVFRGMATTDGGLSYRKDLLPPSLLEYIQEHSADRLSLREIAERCFYNPSYFSRLFKQCEGVTLSDYIHNRRIHNACELLKTSRLSVDEICIQVGYSDKTLFYRQFKNRIGVSPAQYRKDNC